MIAFFGLIFLAISVRSYEDRLKVIYPLFGIAEKCATSTNRSSCRDELTRVHYGLKKRETWAVRLLDSSGVPRDGFVRGNNYWLGSYSQCKWISTKSGKSPSSSKSSLSPPFPVDFYVASFTHDSDYQSKLNVSQEDLILVGLCLPSSCSTEELEPVLTSWSLQDPLTVQFVYNFTMKFRSVRLIKGNESLFDYPLLIVFSLIITGIGFLVIFATLYEIYICRPERNLQKFPQNDANSNQWVMRNIQESDQLLHRDNNLNTDYELKVDNFTHKSIPVPINVAIPENEIDSRRGKRFFRDAFLSFSAASNTAIIMRTEVSRKETVPAIHGLRFLAIVWIISLYTVYYLKDFADNKPLLLRISQGFSERIVSNSTFSVDTFFFTSGFLLSYVYYRNQRGSSRANDSFSTKRKVNEFCFMLINRFIRLTPMYLIVLMIANISIRRNNRTSLFELTELSQNACEKYWWRNLLYINNLFKAKEMCMSWSWYLSTEMQFFMLGSALLIASSRYWKLSVSLTGALVIGSSLLNGYSSYAISVSPKFDRQLSSIYTLHYPPWTRMGPYLIGLCAGYLAIHLKGKLICNKATLIACWTVATICNLWPLFGLYNGEISVISTAAYDALSRPAWAIALSWIVIACTTNHAGIVNEMLSYPGWTPLSKLSFSAYLISPLIINLTYSSSETPIHLDFFPAVVYFVGFVGITYSAALLLSLLFEMPFVRIGKWLMGPRNHLNQLNQQ